MDPQELLAPMVATVVRVEVGPGDAVSAGQPVVVLESMKMEHLIRAPAAGVVSRVGVAAGDQVKQDQPLAGAGCGGPRRIGAGRAGCRS